MSLTDEQKLDVAKRFSEAVATNDGEGYLALCAAEALTWHNFDNAEVAPQTSVATFGWLHKTVKNLRWESLSCEPTASGFVNQMVMRGTAKGGELEVQTCIIVRLNDEGLITRISEYLDPAQAKALQG